MSHIQRIQAAIDYIENHLKEELATERVAQIAYFSMWHFQHIFSAAVGESVQSYIRKRRLASTLVELKNTKKRIIEIAIDYQFESQEAFTRSFKSHFGFTPGDYRKNSDKSLLSLNKPRVTIEYLNHLYEGVTMQPKIITIDTKQIVGLSTRFISIMSQEKNNHIVIPKLWDTFFNQISSVKNRANSSLIGVCSYISDPSKKNHPDECFYLAGAEVSNIESEATPTEMESLTVPAGRYAVFTHKGPLSKLDHTMNYIFGSWLPKSKEELRDAPDLEIYGDRFNPNSEDSEFEILIPIQ